LNAFPPEIHHQMLHVVKVEILDPKYVNVLLSGGMDPPILERTSPFQNVWVCHWMFYDKYKTNFDAGGVYLHTLCVSNESLGENVDIPKQKL
jgi:hypothetical protein